MDANELWSKVRKAGLKGPEEVQLPAKPPPIFEVNHPEKFTEESIERELGSGLHLPFPRFLAVCTTTPWPMVVSVWDEGEEKQIRAWVYVRDYLVNFNRPAVVCEAAGVRMRGGGWETKPERLGFGDWTDWWTKPTGTSDMLESTTVLNPKMWVPFLAQLLAAINAPINHVVRIDPKDARWKSDQTPPLEKLPRHILLRRKDVEKRWKTSHAETGKTVMPHFRRGHWRILRDEMYKQRQGEKVWVRPTKVGEPDVEWSESGQRYTVIA